jgi:hypothetical protein
VPRGVDSMIWKVWFRAHAEDERILLTSREHAYERVVASLERLCVSVTRSPAADRARGDWPKRRQRCRLETRLREFGPGAIHVAVAAHPIAVMLFPHRRCKRAVSRFVKTLMYD